MVRRTLYTVPHTPPEVRLEFRREARLRGVQFLEEIAEWFVAPENSPNLVWASDIAWDAYEVSVPSVAIGAKQLMNALRAARPADIRDETTPKTRWILLDGLHHRRAALIAERLALTKADDLSPPLFSAPPRVGFFLASPDRALAIFDSLGPYPGGAIPFREEKVGPPSRAYLKLWEACTRLGIRPRAGETAVDLGSCPGGWTWALAKLGAEVFSIDGAPLDPSVAALPGVVFKKGDAFRLDPQDALSTLSRKPAKFDWVFSDMICEPARLPDLLRKWADYGEHFVISVKFKGEADLDAIEKLASFPGAKLRHLRQNKHELTWVHGPGVSRF